MTTSWAPDEISSPKFERMREDYYQHLDLDPFQVTQDEGKFTLADYQTEFLDAQGLDADQLESIETQFIDELYGTSEGQTIVDGKNVEHSQGEWQSTYFDDQGAIAQGTDDSIWGLDLRRTMLDEDGETIVASDPEYYEHLTRGEVDWASYQNDPKYVEAFDRIADDLNDGDRVELSDLTSDKYTDSQKAEFIRKANLEMSDPWHSGKGKKNEHEVWENRVDKDKIFRDKENNLFIDGEQQQTLLDLYNSPDGRLTVNSPKEQDPIKERRVIGRPNIPGVTWTPTGKGWDKPSLKNPAKLRLPGNIPKSWVNKTPTNPPAPKGGTKE